MPRMALRTMRQAGPERIAKAGREERQRGVTERHGREAERRDRREHVEELEGSAVAPGGERGERGGDDEPGDGFLGNPSAGAPRQRERREGEHDDPDGERGADEAVVEQGVGGEAQEGRLPEQAS